MPSFGAYGKNDEGGGVVGLIAEIIREASSLEAEATVAELRRLREERRGWRRRRAHRRDH